ncbi:Protein PHR1-LIKE 1 [Platanthera guangdongensis]|uniref:Protein PHR1-LIKE 1 n=1 Tax=Platanthera guangdongensis TaxID=2320717 RepID=A0ABR2LFE6_9ASPA
MLPLFPRVYFPNLRISSHSFSLSSAISVASALTRPTGTLSFREAFSPSARPGAFPGFAYVQVRSSPSHLKKPFLRISATPAVPHRATTASKKIGCHEPTYGSLSSSSFDFLSPSEKVKHSSLLSDCTPWSTNLSSYNSFSCFDDEPSMPPCINSSSSQKPLEFAPSPFSSAEYLIDFSRLQHQISPPPLSSQPPLNPASQFSGVLEKYEEVSHSWEAFESDVKLPLQEYGNSAALHKRHEHFYRQHQNNRVQLVDQSKEEGLAGHILANPLLQRTNFQLQNEKKYSTDAPATIFIPSSGISGPIKTRIRWTPDLHEKFVECVNSLGGKLDRKGSTNELQQIDPNKYIFHDKYPGIKITEALQMQLQVQRHLHDQLEIQQNLQIRIEAQSRQLQKLFKEQMESNKNLVGRGDLDELFPGEWEENS